MSCWKRVLLNTWIVLWNKYSQRKRSVEVVRKPGKAQKVGMWGTKGNLKGVFRDVCGYWTASTIYSCHRWVFWRTINLNKSEDKWEIWMGRNNLLSFPLCPPRQAATRSCRWSFQLRCGPVQSRRSSSWSWSTTWAPSRPCPLCLAQTQTGPRSATSGTSQNRSKRPLQCLLVRPWI